MSPILPFDVIALIIDIAVENKDINLLKEFALVSHSFLQICSKHLFATIELHDTIPRPHEYVHEDDRSSKRGFVKLLKSKSDVANYIRKLTYKVCHYDGNDRLLSPILLNFLPTFSHLNCLTIAASDRNWIHLDSSLTSSFLHLMHLPTINHIDLSHIECFPLSSLALSVNLHRLDISYMSCPYGSPEIVETARMPKIREFHTSGSALLTTELLHAKRQDGQPAFNFIHLRRLSMVLCQIEDRQNLQHLLQNAKVLGKLHLSVVHGSLVGLLSSARTLKVLDLSVPFWDRRSSIFLGGACEALEALAGHNMLEALSFEVRVGAIIGGTEGFVGSIIQRVEEVLVKSGWSALRQVSIKVKVAPFKNGEKLLEALQSLPNRYLRHLSKLDSVAFNYSAILYEYS
jgi:hypothetical protein